MLQDLRGVHLASALRGGTVLALVVTLLAGLLLTPVQAATLIVTNTDNSGPGSLRQAIADGAPGDTITFDNSLAGQTITLNSTISLTKNLTIDGSALATPVTISGNNAVQVFWVDTSVNANLNALTITAGFSGWGGAIYNSGTLTVTNSTLIANRGTWAGAINNSGTLTLAGSIVSANTATWGGAILSDGTLVVTDTAFSANSASYGGAILNDGTLSVARSTFSSNSGSVGGAILNASGPGEISTLSVTNSTFSANAAGAGGAIYNQGALTLMNSTLSANTGRGLYVSGGSLSYANTIVANSPSGADCFIIPNSASIATNTSNLVEDGSCAADYSGDPLLGELADNGGPTQTFALLADSPAIDAGDATACLVTDQRGVARPLGAGCDIGAYEYPLPSARTDPATAITARNATLNGTANANYIETVVTFEYGLTTAYGTSLPAAEGPLTGLSDTVVSYAIEGLTPNTTYHYRVVAVNSLGTTLGADLAFTTLAEPPAAATSGASNVTPKGATLHGLVNAGNGSTTATFQYGLTDAYGESVVAIESPVTGMTDTAVSHELTGLTPNTTYHYRVVAENSAGRTYGVDMTFTTGLYRILLIGVRA